MVMNHVITFRLMQLEIMMQVIFLVVDVTVISMEMHLHLSSESTYFFSDPLWDGSDCSTNNTSTCCLNEHQPWFYHNLGNSTTDDIEVRICISPTGRGGVVVDQLELYIQ